MRINTNNSLDSKYLNLLRDILINGTKKGDRTGTGTISVFGREIRHKMSDGFPLLTTKKMHFKSIVTELIWFLRGETNIKYLVENGCNIWNGDAYKKYETVFNLGRKMQSSVSDVSKMVKLTKGEFIEKIKTDDEFAKKWGDLGPIYGKQWRNWRGFKHGWHDVAKTIDGIEPHIDWLEGIDQIKDIIDQLKNNPDSRRMIVNAWNTGEIDEMTLPPCHYSFQFYTRELTEKERWYWLVMESRKKGVIVPWERMATPHHEWFDSYNKFWGTEWPLNIPKRAISLKWNQRSVDSFLGLPFNIASYGLLLQLIADEVNMIPDELIGSLGDTHIYLNHIDAVKEQLSRTGHPLPNLYYNSEFWQPDSEDNFHFVDKIMSMEPKDFEIENYLSDDKITAELSN